MNGGYELYLEGCELLERGKYREAASRFMQSLGELPHFKTFERLGECCFAMNDPEKAFEYAEEAYKLNSRNDKTAFRYAELLIKNKNDILKAQNILTEILARNPSYKAARVLLDEINSK